MNAARDMALVGPAMRQANDRSAKLKLSDGERRTLFAVVSLVSSWSWLEEWVYVGQVAAAANLSERHTRRCLDRLAGAFELIVWEPRRGKPGQGPGVRSLLGLPPAGESGHLGRPVSRQAETESNRTDSEAETGQIGALKPDTLDVRSTRRNPEKKSREEDEEHERGCDNCGRTDDVVAWPMFDDAMLCVRCGTQRSGLLRAPLNSESSAAA